MRCKKKSDSTSIHESGFFHLEVIILLVFLVFLTGAGQFLWRHSLRAGEYCRDVAHMIGWEELYPTCYDIGITMADIKYRVYQALGVAGYAQGMTKDDLLHEMTEYFNLSMVGLDAHTLKELINPDMLRKQIQHVTSPIQQAQFAVTQGHMGSRLFSRGNVGNGLDYMRNAANSGHYGAISQLQLGSIYGGGLGGVPQNLGAANYYHHMAYQSLQKLQNNATPAAQQILQNLPVQPHVLMQQLAQIIRSAR